jgi:hypothetical protein
VIGRRGGLRDRSATASVRWISFDAADASEDASGALQERGVLLHPAWGRLPDYRAPYRLGTGLLHQYRFHNNIIRNSCRHQYVWQTGSPCRKS